MRPDQDVFIFLAGERATFELGVGDAEKATAASVQGELMLTEILDVVRREFTGGVEADFVQHPPEIDKASDFIIATAQTRNVRHRLTSAKADTVASFDITA